MLKWKRIVVATDFSPMADAALASARRIAKATDDAEIVLLHVVEPPPPFYPPLVTAVGPPEIRELWAEEPRREMAARVAKLGRGKERVRGVVRFGVPSQEIVELAEEFGADGICLGCSGHSRIERLLLGSTAENVLRRATVPVLVTGEKPVGAIRRVLLPIDMDAGSRSAVRFASERFGERVRLTALFVLPSYPTYMPETWPASYDRFEFEASARRFLDEEGGQRIGLKVVAFQDPAWTVIEEIRSRRPDLVLLASHGRRRVARMFFGSVTEKVVRHSERPVLVLPGPSRRAVRKSRRRKARLAGEIESSARRRGRRSKPEPDLSDGEIRLRAAVSHTGRGPWTGQAHTGRGGPPGRRGSGQGSGTRPSRTKGERG